MQKINCPKCSNEIDVDEVLSSKLEEQLQAKFAKQVKDFEEKRNLARQKYEETKKQMEEEISKKEAVLQQRATDLEKEINDKLRASLDKEKEILTKEIKQTLEKENSDKEKYLNEKLLEKEEKLKLARAEQIKLLEEKDKLKEERENFELEKKKELEILREEVTNKLSDQLSKQHQFELAEKEKMISDMKKANEEMQRKLNQKSQQLQGEVQELALEEILLHHFPQDEFEAVGKGVNGADVIENVRGRMGEECGIIAWESKRTKAWTEGWVAKLKDDMRLKKADLAILVSNILPKNVHNFGWYQGIWVCDFESVIGLAQALRTQLISLQNARASMENQDEKMAELYRYLTSSEFAHKIEAIVETYTDMKNDLEKEKLYFQKNWSKKEKQIGKIIENTLNMYGGLQGMIGNELPKIEQLELPALPN